MGKTITKILSWVDEVVSNNVNSTTKIGFLSDLLGDGEFRRYNRHLTIATTQTASSQADYSLPSTNIKVADIEYLAVSNTTYNSTDVLASTTQFTEYKFAGIEDTKVGSRFLEHWSSDGVYKLALVPTPDDVYHMRYHYKPYYGPYNASSDSTTIINCDNDLIKWLQYKLAARICKSLAFPRTDLANNYELDAMDAMDAARTNYYNHIHRKSKRNISYKGWW